MCALRRHIGGQGARGVRLPDSKSITQESGRLYGSWMGLQAQQLNGQEREEGALHVFYWGRAL